MDCRELEKHLWAVAEANVPPDEKVAVEIHLARCDDCRTLAAEWTSLIRQANEVNDVETSPYFFARLKGRIEAHEAGQGETSRRFLPRMLQWKSLAVAASLVLGVGAGVRLGDAVAARQSTEAPEVGSEEYLFLAALDSVPHGSLAEVLLDNSAGEEEMR
jgi:anti-sigma factor RsiW